MPASKVSNAGFVLEYEISHLIPDNPGDIGELMFFFSKLHKAPPEQKRTNFRQISEILLSAARKNIRFLSAIIKNKLDFHKTSD